MALGVALAVGAFLYAAILVIDPYDTVWFSPDLPRAPTATNQRFSFPALARKGRFDSAIVGTSTTRLLRPGDFDPLFGARFVNLSMNSATAWEQAQILGVFRRAQARRGQTPRFVLIGIDSAWCTPGETYAKLTPRPFPEWMYDENRWNDLLNLFNFPTLEEVGRQFGHVTGIKPSRYGRDGYTNFLPDPSVYDLGRAQRVIYRGREPQPLPAFDPVQVERALGLYRESHPTHPLLDEMLRALPAETRKILLLVPSHVQILLGDGINAFVGWRACKAAVAGIAAAVPGPMVIDFMIPSRITRDDANYWDPLHYSVDIAQRLATLVAQAIDTNRAEPDLYEILVSGDGSSRSPAPAPSHP
jgi:hypothetical protein